jgi:hypothetical protein
LEELVVVFGAVKRGLEGPALTRVSLLNRYLHRTVKDFILIGLDMLNFDPLALSLNFFALGGDILLFIVVGAGLLLQLGGSSLGSTATLALGGGGIGGTGTRLTCVHQVLIVGDLLLDANDAVTQGTDGAA